MQSIVVHYDEIALKGGRRRYFVRKLVANIRRSAALLADAPVRVLRDRVLLGPFADEEFPALAECLAAVPGVSWFAQVRQFPLEVESLGTIAEEFHAGEKPRSFRVSARRAFKDFPLDSMGIDRELGRMIQERTGWPVDLERPELTVHVHVTAQGILSYHARHRGLGGLPVGSTGKLVCLVSGGIDSPVAAFKMMCRGCSVVLVHFHNFGPDSPGVRDKLIKLARRLARFQPVTRLYLVPFAKVQADLVAGIPPKMRMVAYRRAMLRLAVPILEKERAAGFVVGDSVGQVASQTPENLQATYPAVDYPVFAPLIGDRKLTITELAESIGTFEISILPYDDCCQLLVAKSPETRCRLAEITDYESRLPLDQHYEDVRQGLEIVEFAQPEMEPQALSR